MDSFHWTSIWFLYVSAAVVFAYLTLIMVYAGLRIISNSKCHTRRSFCTQREYMTQRVIRTLQINQNDRMLGTSCKVFMMTYLGFRLFYTFLFTVSIGFSVFLCIDFPGVILLKSLRMKDHISMQKTAVVQTAHETTHTISPLHVNFELQQEMWWIAEVIKMDTFANEQLVKQQEQTFTEIRTCGLQNTIEHQRLYQSIQDFFKNYRKWLSPDSNNLLFNGTFSESAQPDVNITLTDDYMMNGLKTIDHFTRTLLEKSAWNLFLDKVDQYLSKLRDHLDTEVIDQWSPFDRMLSNLLGNMWSLPARRALNQTRASDNLITEVDMHDYSHTTIESPGTEAINMNQPAGLSRHRQQREAEALKLAYYLGVPQPQHARLTGARLWNSFRNMVPPLPSQMPMDLANYLETLFTDRTIPRILARITAKSYNRLVEPNINIDLNGQTIGINDKQHRIPSGEQELRFTRVSKTPAYHLTLTQLRMVLLILDGFIIIARCYQTYRFMQRAWFGTVERIGPAQLQERVSQSDLSEHSGCLPNQNSCQKIPQSSHKLGVHDLPTKAKYSSYILDVNAERFPACYCCLNAHYLLIVIGLGLIIVGVFLIWHSRSNWSQTGDTTYSIGKAMDGYLVRTNTILSKLQTVSWNSNNMKRAQRAAIRNYLRFRQWVNRATHQKLQIIEQYTNELCDIERALRGNNTESTAMDFQNHIRPITVASEGNPCLLLGKDSTFNQKARLALSRYLNNDRDGNVRCTFSKLTSNVYIKDVSESDLQATNQSVGFNILTLQSDRGGTSGKSRNVHTNDRLAWSTHAGGGGLPALLSACQIHLLVGLTVVLAMGGFHVCVHLIKVTFRSFAPMRIKKINVITTQPQSVILSEHFPGSRDVQSS